MRTPLHCAVQNNHYDVVELLVNNGVQVNQKDIGNKTPLQYAEDKGFKKIIEFLKKRGGI